MPGRPALVGLGRAAHRRRIGTASRRGWLPRCLRDPRHGHRRPRGAAERGCPGHRQADRATGTVHRQPVQHRRASHPVTRAAPGRPKPPAAQAATSLAARDGRPPAGRQHRDHTSGRPHGGLGPANETRRGRGGGQEGIDVGEPILWVAGIRARSTLRHSTPERCAAHGGIRLWCTAIRHGDGSNAGPNLSVPAPTAACRRSSGSDAGCARSMPHWPASTRIAP